MRRIDMETVLICAVMAVIGAFGIIVGVAAFAGIQFGESNAVAWTGAGCTLGGLLWGMLLICNNGMLEKNV